ncbi:hypothetical protein AGR4B_Lc10370 [Agrobacterium tumefaciens str. CFBP 5621]|nr:hypothetical protein AGR4B_Lc10370 [Agrobacterium tumefaciens str. CFBP 5621]
MWSKAVPKGRMRGHALRYPPKAGKAFRHTSSLFSNFQENTFPSVPISHFRRIILPQSERKGETRGAFREPAAGIDKHGSGRPCF